MKLLYLSLIMLTSYSFLLSQKHLKPTPGGTWPLVEERKSTETPRLLQLPKPTKGVRAYNHFYKLFNPYVVELYKDGTLEQETHTEFRLTLDLISREQFDNARIKIDELHNTIIRKPYPKDKNLDYFHLCLLYMRFTATLEDDPTEMVAMFAPVVEHSHMLNDIPPALKKTQFFQAIHYVFQCAQKEVDRRKQSN